MTTDWRRLALLLIALLLAGAARAAPSVQIEELTWTELRERIAAGATIALVPIGGTEQNGPHMALGKHNVRVKAIAARIAGKLGNALVAPVMAYVPEGSIEPPVAHMRFPGTLSIPDAAFEAVLEGTSRSLRNAGFTDVVFLGDHGGYQKNEERVAAKLTKEWAGKGRVHALVEYYRAAQQGHAELLAARGFGRAEIGQHAGLADTALALAIDESLVRRDRLDEAAKAGVQAGVDGDPRRASVDLGQIGIDRIVETSVSVIRERTRAR